MSFTTHIPFRTVSTLHLIANNGGKLYGLRQGGQTNSDAAALHDRLCPGAPVCAAVGIGL